MKTIDKLRDRGFLYARSEAYQVGVFYFGVTGMGLVEVADRNTRETVRKVKTRQPGNVFDSLVDRYINSED